MRSHHQTDAIAPGFALISADGEPIGVIDRLHRDHSDTTDWALVTTGLFGLGQRFVPLAHTTTATEGSARVPYDKRTVDASPPVGPHNRHLPPSLREHLHDHYRPPADRQRPNRQLRRRADLRPRASMRRHRTPQRWTDV